MSHDRSFHGETSGGTASTSPSMGGGFGKRTLAESAPGATIQRKALEGAPVDSLPGAGEALEQARGSSGSAPDAGVRGQVERATGASLEGARVHTGAESAAAASAVGARAYTTGNDIHFGAGEYKPGSADGNRLLAHELAHTVSRAASRARAAAPCRRRR